MEKYRVQDESLFRNIHQHMRNRDTNRQGQNGTKQNNRDEFGATVLILGQLKNEHHEQMRTRMSFPKKGKNQQKKKQRREKEAN